jgi:hypothetical protein
MLDQSSRTFACHHQWSRYAERFPDDREDIREILSNNFGDGVAVVELDASRSAARPKARRRSLAIYCLAYASPPDPIVDRYRDTHEQDVYGFVEIFTPPRL